jgi:hypothetical protein
MSRSPGVTDVATRNRLPSLWALGVAILAQKRDSSPRNQPLTTNTVLNDFFDWSGGELPSSDGHILIYMECSYPFEGFDEDEVVEYLRSEILADASDFGGEGDGE